VALNCNLRSEVVMGLNFLAFNSFVKGKIAIKFTLDISTFLVYLVGEKWHVLQFNVAIIWKWLIVSKRYLDCGLLVGKIEVKKIAFSKI